MLEATETPEARWLGMSPNEASPAQGALTVAALGVDPPARSMHFHVSLLSATEGVISAIAPKPRADELGPLLSLAGKLNTRSLTFLQGPELDHGLVWEQLGDLHTFTDEEAMGQEIKKRMPEGDGEFVLRRFIEDSVNLLSEHEANRRREDEGFALINLLWPWGQGVRGPVPNLALRRGEPANVMSASMRLQGLSRLAGYRHTDLDWMGTGVHTKFEEIARRCLTGSSSIVVLDAVAKLRREGMVDEAEYVGRELDARLLKPLLESQEPMRLLVVAPSDCGAGLTLDYDSQHPNDNDVPFDERSLDEARIPFVDAEDAVDAALTADD